MSGFLQTTFVVAIFYIASVLGQKAKPVEVHYQLVPLFQNAHLNRSHNGQLPVLLRIIVPSAMDNDRLPHQAPGDSSVRLPSLLEAVLKSDLLSSTQVSHDHSTVPESSSSSSTQTEEANSVSSTSAAAVTESSTTISKRSTDSVLNTLSSSVAEESTGASVRRQRLASGLLHTHETENGEQECSEDHSQEATASSEHLVSLPSTTPISTTTTTTTTAPITTSTTTTTTTEAPVVQNTTDTANATLPASDLKSNQIEETEVELISTNKESVKEVRATGDAPEQAAQEDCETTGGHAEDTPTAKELVSEVVVNTSEIAIKAKRLTEENTLSINSSLADKELVEDVPKADDEQVEEHLSPEECEKSGHVHDKISVTINKTETKTKRLSINSEIQSTSTTDQTTEAPTTVPLTTEAPSTENPPTAAPPLSSASALVSETTATQATVQQTDAPETTVTTTTVPTTTTTTAQPSTTTESPTTTTASITSVADAGASSSPEAVTVPSTDSQDSERTNDTRTPRLVPLPLVRRKQNHSETDCLKTQLAKAAEAQKAAKITEETEVVNTSHTVSTSVSSTSSASLQLTIPEKNQTITIPVNSSSKSKPAGSSSSSRQTSSRSRSSSSQSKSSSQTKSSSQAKRQSTGQRTTASNVKRQLTTTTTTAAPRLKASFVPIRLLAAAAGSTELPGNLKDEQQLEPYSFSYEAASADGKHFRNESKDAFGRIMGLYTLSEADGRQRLVEYVADERGFRATLKTNEPGSGRRNPADVTLGPTSPVTASIPTNVHNTRSITSAPLKSSTRKSNQQKTSNSAFFRSSMIRPISRQKRPSATTPFGPLGSEGFIASPSPLPAIERSSSSGQFSSESPLSAVSQNLLRFSSSSKASTNPSTLAESANPENNTVFLQTPISSSDLSSLLSSSALKNVPRDKLLGVLLIPVVNQQGHATGKRELDQKEVRHETEETAAKECDD